MIAHASQTLRRPGRRPDAAPRRPARPTARTHSFGRHRRDPARPRQELRRQHGPERDRPPHPRRPVRRHRRQERLRQEHAAAPPRRPRPAERRPALARRRLRRRPRAAAAASCSRSRGSCPGRGWSTTSPSASARRGAAAERLERARAALDQVGLAAKADGGRRPSPAASASAWRSPARWSAGRSFLALDEPLGALDALTRIDMQALVEGCGGRKASPPCSSPTTSRKRWRSPTASW